MLICERKISFTRLNYIGHVRRGAPKYESLERRGIRVVKLSFLIGFRSYCPPCDSFFPAPDCPGYPTAHATRNLLPRGGILRSGNNKTLLIPAR